MRVTLELTSGHHAGRRVSLVASQSIKVGNTSWADFVVRDDQSMASQHFALETDRLVCRVRDLGQGGVTQLNGAPIAEPTIVRDGDRISAGESQFLVRVEGDNIEAALAAAPAAETRAAQGPQRPSGPLRPKKYQQLECDSQAMHYSGEVAETPVVELVDILKPLGPLALVVDLRRVQAPEGLREAPPLFDWLGEAARHNSPVVVGPELLAEPGPLVQSAWGKDAVISVYSPHSTDELLAKLRQAVRPDADHVMGICWPSILSQVLKNFPPDYVRDFLGGTGVVLVESIQGGQRWNVFSLEPLDELLQQGGLEPAQQPAEAVA